MNVVFDGGIRGNEAVLREIYSLSWYGIGVHPSLPIRHDLVVNAEERCGSEWLGTS